MRPIIKCGFLATAFFLMNFISNAQATYYWVGGTGSLSSPQSLYGLNRWNTSLDGSGTTRPAEAPNDILIVDGSNVGGATPTTGLINAYTSATHYCGQLKFINGARMNISRINAGLAKFVIYGDGTSNQDFVVDAGCDVTVGGPSPGYDVTFILGAKANTAVPGSVDTVATGAVSGNFYLGPIADSAHTRSYITTSNSSTLTFNNGGKCYITDSTASSGFNGSDTSSIFFKSGSSMYYYSGRSPIAVSSTFPITTFEKGSNLYFRGSNVSYVDGSLYSNSVWTSGQNFGNIIIENKARINGDGTFNCTQLKVLDNATLNLTRTSSGSSKYFIYGDNTPAEDFVVDPTSTVSIGGPLAGYDISIGLGVNADTVATGSVSGNLVLSPLSNSIHTRSYVTTGNGSTLTFNSGGKCYITDSTSTSGFNGSDTLSIFFKAGSNLYYYSGRSPIASSSSLTYSTFEPGSNFYFRGSNVSYLDGITPYSSSSWTSAKSFGNIFIQNGSNVKADGTLYKVEDFTIDNGCSFTSHTSGSTPILGNLTVNGTLSYPAAGSTNNLVMGGNVPQQISGTGTIKMPNFVVGNSSDVSLNKLITIDTSISIYGKINFGTSGQVAGRASFTSKVRATTTDVVGNSTAGSYLLNGFAPNTISNALGLRIAGPGVQENTNVIYTSNGGGIIMLSKPATAAGTAATFTFSSDSATIQHANANGMDSVTGTVIVSGNKSFQGGTNYIIDSVTSWPFGIGSNTTSLITLGKVVTNANVNTNFNAKIRGGLVVKKGNFNIRSVDTVTVITAAPAVMALPLDFESSTLNYAFNDFDGGNATVINNPQSGGINTSAKVVKMIKNNGATWGGSWIGLDAPIDFSVLRTFKMKVYSPRVGAKVLLKVENQTNAGISFEQQVSTTVANAWEELVFDFSTINLSNTYQKVVVIFDNGTMGDGSANYTFYFDDIILN